MKNNYLIYILIAGFTVCSCNDKLAYDFAAVDSPKAMDSLFTEMKNNGVAMDTSAYMREITGTGMHYAGVPIKKAILGKKDMFLYTDSLNFSGKKLLEAVEARKGFGKLYEGYTDMYQFKWSQETADTELELRQVNGAHLAAIGDKDYAELEVVYKTVYDVSLANLHKKVSRFEHEPNYVLNIECYSCQYNVYLNDINLITGYQDETISLNPFITENKPTTIRIETLVNNNNSRESNSITASIGDANAKSALTGLDRTPINPKKTNSFELQFDPKLPFQVNGWSDGIDLRKDPALHDKIRALYTRLANAVLEKDETTIDSMLNQYRFEEQQVLYNDNFKTAREYWESLLILQNNAYIYHLAEDFEIEFNSNGRLIYALPQNKAHMLLFTGKGYNRPMNFFLYQPQGSTDLKIIR